MFALISNVWESKLQKLQEESLSLFFSRPCLHVLQLHTAFVFWEESANRFLHSLAIVFNSPAKANKIEQKPTNNCFFFGFPLVHPSPSLPPLPSPSTPLKKGARRKKVPSLKEGHADLPGEPDYSALVASFVRAALASDWSMGSL